MKKTLVLISLFVLFIGSSYSQDANIDFNNQKPYELNIKHQKNLELQSKIVYGENRFSMKDSNIGIPQDNRENPNKKSPYLGGLLSGIIPGAGQFYAKSYIKSASFLAAEVGLWVAYAIFQKKGNDQTDLYKSYANQNWDMRKYAQWLKDQGFPKASDINLNNPNEILRAQINACEEINFSHTLPRPGEQQYYEVIGKYQNFLVGWSSANPLQINKSNYIDFRLVQVEQYMTDRQKANDYFDNGSLMITVVIINHILSAADGVLSVVRYNNKLDIKTSIDVQSKYSLYLQKSVIVPHLNVSVSF
ncbi:MAG: hypothetical protein WC358_12440 [Ignavibacteria bacterium]|jgi:hypothetical protein